MHGEPRSCPSIIPAAIFLASLTDSVNGITHGRWVAAGVPVAELRQSLADVLASSAWTLRTGEPAEEWIVLDHESFVGPAPDRHETLERIVELACWPRDGGEASW